MLVDREPGNRLNTDRNRASPDQGEHPSCSNCPPPEVEAKPKSGPVKQPCEAQCKREGDRAPDCRVVGMLVEATDAQYGDRTRDRADNGIQDAEPLQDCGGNRENSVSRHYERDHTWRD